MNTKENYFASNRVADIVRRMHQVLDSIYGEREVDVFARILCEEYLGWDRVQYLTRRQETINQSDMLRFHWAIEGLVHETPIQYIVGHTQFAGCDISVTADTLIPRPETEEMVQRIISKGSVVQRILDLCTGSGCIAIALKKAFPDAKVVGVDLSTAALEVAKQNAKQNEVDVTFLHGDILGDNIVELLGLNDRFDWIVSNPPYIRKSEQSSMRNNVKRYEPSMALFVPDDNALIFYKAIADIGKQTLSKQGIIYIEINEMLSNETQQIYQERYYQTKIHKDFREKERFIEARLE